MQQVTATAPSIPKKRNKFTYVPAPLPDDPQSFVRLPSVLAALGISRTAFLDGIKQKNWPAGRLLTPRCRVWTAGEIRELLTKLEGGEAAA